MSFKTKIFDGLQVFMRKSADDFLFESNKFATDVINLYKDTLPKEWINYKLKILFFESQLTEFYGRVSWTDRVVQLSCENIYKLPHTNIIHPVVFRNENDMPIPQAVISSNHNFTSLVLNITNDTSGSGNLISNNQSNDSTPIVPYLAIGAVVGGAIAYGVYKAYSNYKSFNSIPREDLEFKDASSASSQEQGQLIQHNC
ncbi:hypothetical protein [Spiroplasma sp. AdecLV25b]|uniref:hypothetical protein n=1 Tax=Spiroplasma sp. AdecLV25b TaxID=3027162 RepID=UPI0027E14BAB|nr:hypothetical protein [Spiroplasma sp. AdecLV25b]